MALVRAFVTIFKKSLLVDILLINLFCILETFADVCCVIRLGINNNVSANNEVAIFRVNIHPQVGNYSV